MLFITKEHLKPGMILARDITLYSDDIFNTILLTENQVLNDIYINKIKFHDIPGAYIENKAFADVTVESNINQRLEAKSLSEIKSVYYKFRNTMGKIDVSTIKQISSVVDSLISEILVKKQLSNNIVEFKNYDDYTYQHCLNVAMLSISTGVSLGLSEYMLHELGMAGLLHDIGKMLIPLNIINKPDKLTKEEFDIMKTHPIKSVDQLEHLVSYDVLRGIESHHEKVDGTGYPYGRKKDNIHLYGRILAICDVYDALTSDRSYRKNCFPSEVIEYIMGCADTHFDYEILSKFLKNIVAYPVGTFVRLSNDKIGVVVKNFSENIMRPVVRIINEDNTVGADIDLLYDYNYMNITITGMGYDYGKIDFNSISKAITELKEGLRMKNNYEYLVSACLCGEKCRYDGKVFISKHIKQLVDEGKAIMVCPEVLGGMSVPRLPCEIKGGRVLNINNENKTDSFLNGAIKVLEIAKKYEITKAILKEKSPSCGSNYIYNGNFNKELIPGEGLTTKLLRENGIQVVSDELFH